MAQPLQPAWDLRGHLNLIYDVMYFFHYLAYILIIKIYKVFVPDPPKSLKQEIILVTGGGSGIGKELCLHLAKLETDLTIITWDVNEPGNSDTAKQLKELGVQRTFAFTVNVADRKQVEAAAKKIRDEVGDVTMLFNNAGVLGEACEGWKLSSEAIERVVNVNILGQIWTMKEFLPQMIEKRKGHVIQLGSILSLQYQRFTSVYVASKHAVKGLMESIKEDLRVAGHENIHVSIVYPYNTSTDMMAPFNGTSTIRYPILRDAVTPKTAAETILKGVRGNVEHIYIPGFVRLVPYLSALFPPEVIRKLLDRSGFCQAFGSKHGEHDLKNR